MTRNRIWSLIALLCLVGAAQVSHAGLTDALKKSTAKAAKDAQTAAEQAAKQKTPATKPAEETPPEATAKDEKAAPGKGDVAGVSTKFDFVPGDKVLFTDDFTQDELGEFPAKWKLAEGTFEVVEQAKERWLRSMATIGHVRMKAPAGLPEFWTLEFDAQQLDQAGNVLTVSALLENGQSAWQVIFPYSGRSLYCESGKVHSDTPFGGTPAGRHHFMFMARGTALKVYVDRERLASMPDVHAGGAPVEIDFQLWSEKQPMITNVRFAEGCKPANDVLDKGPLVTYGIRFDTGSDVVLPESAPVLRQVSGYMTQHPDVALKVTGHTDNVGKPESNLDLSKRRAASVKKVLVEEFGVNADRLTTDGKGDTQALASNAKPEGRAMNRRVEFAKP